MDNARKELGKLTDIEAISACLTVNGLRVIDVGCGPAKVSRELCALGASVTGIEPDPIQAEKNRNAAPTDGLTFLEGRAESLPFPTGSVDGVFFFRSLHHVPVAQMDAALAEAARIVKPDTGFLCVVEPGMTGSHFKVMRPFNDETLVRTEAQAALQRTATGLFRSAEMFHYAQFPTYPNFEAMVTRITGHTYIDVKREHMETEEVRGLFEEGRTQADDYVFEQPMLLNLYRGPLGG
ncbi:MAG: hypothetical protein B7X08_01020 [Acidocella sp. 20-63-7]|nr:MAG: hypothetical protein B7X08_01020 [Acidocella sp. 20-63-7]HQT45808.1 class I SAM-dependent methyltransferase [Acidocella sp.]